VYEALRGASATNVTYISEAEVLKLLVYEALRGASATNVTYI
jgi:hypothetical protein